jgi:hypothetical protein
MLSSSRFADRGVFYARECRSGSPMATEYETRGTSRVDMAIDTYGTVLLPIARTKLCR